MDVTWQTLSHAPLEFESYIPAGFPGLRLPGFRVMSSEGAFGKLCFQTFTSNSFCFQYSVLQISQAFLLQARTKLEGLFVRIMLENHVEHQIRGAEELIIREGQFSIMTGIAPEAKLHYQKPDQYSSFDAFYSTTMLQKVLRKMPAAKLWFSGELSRQPHILTPPKPSEPVTQALLDDLLKDPQDNRKAHDLLINLLEQVEERRKLKVPPPAEQLEKIYEAERIVSDDIRKHYLIPDLAQRAKTNQCTLKTIFPYVFGIGPYKYLLRKRMRLARQLLLQKMPIKNVAKATGFKSTADFTKAFKSYYNERPSDLLN